MATFIHTADWQLGKPFAGIADPAKRARVQQERLEAIRRIGDVARERRAGFVVVAGDLFDSPTPTNTTVAHALAAIASLGVDVYAIPGNHDHGGPGSLWEQPFFRSEHARLAPNFHLLLARQPLILDEAVILPCPLLRRHEAEDPTAWIRGLDFAAFGDRPRIVLAHGSTTAFTGQADDEESAGPPNSIALERLPQGELDAIALGDWHGFVQAGPKAFYSGTHETDRFPKAGQRPGHVACVTVARGAPPVVEAAATGGFRWLTHEIGIDDDGPRRLDEMLTESTRDAGFDRCLVDLSLHGTASLAARRDLESILESWSARLLRLDVADAVRLAPSAEEISGLADRPDDPIISRVAAELIRRLAADEGDGDVIRQAIHQLHSLCDAHAEARG
jgi:DNA repair exonuclease SbcCD nuclease subunit